ncbi:SulP family inorganic anion transporter [Oligoflexus tunisiensis]|uniref:SulP family inorganic anion transporter n=1 Tax=Oligoflexus tunisiensis TaxID=708132 RepID=UPI000B13150E|nr:SulP family inorganic anion transporter [Oligoflexus tunisiensis]
MQKFQTLLLFWKQSWLDVFRSSSLPQDTIAAVTVAAVALPLNIALAVASGLPPSAGLLAGAIGGGIAAIFGGAPLQVTGPAAALNIMVLSITKDYGAVGVAAACLIIGAVQIVLCSLSAGRFMRFVPEAVLAGFTTGVGLKLLDNQIPEFLGFNYTVFEIAVMLERPDWLHEVSWLAVVCGLFVAFLVTTCKPFKRFPAALVGIAIITAVSVQLNWKLDRVGTIPALLPWPALPSLAADRWLSLILATLPLALLAAIESLLSAQAIDRLAQARKPHMPDLELFGQGLANIGSGLVSGMPVSGVVVRSSVNVQCGARSRLSALLHGAILLFSILYLNETMALIPLAALAGLLCVIGMRLIEVHTLAHYWHKDRVQALAFLLTAVGTLTGHLMLGLVLGILVAWFSHWRAGKSESAAGPRPAGAQGRRAVIKNPEKSQRRPAHYHPAASGSNWLSQIRERAQPAASSFVHQKASVIGRVVLGEHVHIAAESSVRADEGSPFFIGSNSNIQDGVVIHALKEKWVNVAGEDWAVFIGEEVSVAHQALIHGPCYIGDHSFVGFQAVVHDSVVGAHCYVGIGAIVVGVEIEAGRYVPHGAVVDSQAKADQLPPVTDAHRHFNEDVVDVNKGLVSAYRRHHQEQNHVRRKVAVVSGQRSWVDRF